MLDARSFCTFFYRLTENEQAYMKSTSPIIVPYSNIGSFTQVSLYWANLLCTDL